MATECVLLGILFVFAWIDWKTQEIPLMPLAVAGCCGALFRLESGNPQWDQAAGGVLVGAALLLGAVLTREKVGAGDALVFCVTGLYLGLWQNLLLLFLASVCAAAAGIILLLGKRCTKNERVPFMPFVLTADVLMLVLTK